MSPLTLAKGIADTCRSLFVDISPDPRIAGPMIEKHVEPGSTDRAHFVVAVALTTADFHTCVARQVNPSEHRRYRKAA